MAGHQEEPFQEAFGDLEVEFSHKSASFSTYLFQDPQVAVIKDVYEAASAYDAVKVLEDGNCQSLTFVGWAQSKADHEIGEVIVPLRIKGLDSISRGREFEPEKEKENLIIQPGDFGGRHLSKQSVTYKSREFEREVKNFNPHSVDLELATIIKDSEDLGLDCQFYLVISDTTFEDLFDEDKKKKKIKSMKDLLTRIRSHFLSE